MKKIMLFFVNLRSYQLFLIFLALILIFAFFIISPHLNSNQKVYAMFWFAMAPLDIVVFSWLYSISRMAYSRAPNGFEKELRFFYIVLLVVFAYALVGSLYVFPKEINALQVQFTELAKTAQSREQLLQLISQVDMGSDWYFQTGFFFLLATFYVGIFVSKLIVSALNQRKAPMNDYLGTFLLLMVLFPIGLWSIQPRINSLATMPQGNSNP